MTPSTHYATYLNLSRLLINKRFGRVLYPQSQADLGWLVLTACNWLVSWNYRVNYLDPEAVKSASKLMSNAIPTPTPHRVKFLWLGFRLSDWLLDAVTQAKLDNVCIWIRSNFYSAAWSSLHKSVHCCPPSLTASLCKWEIINLCGRVFCDVTMSPTNIPTLSESYGKRF
jgi:hypothetical protein